MPEAPAPAAPITDLGLPTMPATKGACRMYYVGLIEDAPFDSIDVPTVVFQTPPKKGDPRPGVIRGKCVNVPKRIGSLHSDGKGNFNHIADSRIGRFEKLFDIEAKAFVEYCKTHVFRKTADYEYPIDDKGNTKKFWRADIEPIDPGMATMRSLHDEDAVRTELISKYVWIVPVEDKATNNGPELTIFEQEQAVKAVGAKNEQQGDDDKGAGKPGKSR